MSQGATERRTRPAKTTKEAAPSVTRVLLLEADAGATDEGDDEMQRGVCESDVGHGNTFRSEHPYGA